MFSSAYKIILNGFIANKLNKLTEMKINHLGSTNIKKMIDKQQNPHRKYKLEINTNQVNISSAAETIRKNLKSSKRIICYKKFVSPRKRGTSNLLINILATNKINGTF